MIRNVDLIKYLPQYVQNYKQIQYIMDTLDPEIQLLEDETEIIKDNQFIANCNETGIGMFENLLEIYPSIDDDLQTRIERVLIKWLDFPPYTLRYLISALNSLYGSENYEFTEDFNNYSFNIKFIDNFSPSDIIGFYEYIEIIKPANLVCSLTRHSNELTDTYAGVILSGKYIKSKFMFDEILDSTNDKVSVFSTVLLSSNYVKEVFTFE